MLVPQPRRALDCVGQLGFPIWEDASSIIRGSRIVKVEPLPGSLATMMSPPIIWQKRLLIACRGRVRDCTGYFWGSPGGRFSIQEILSGDALHHPKHALRMPAAAARRRNATSSQFRRHLPR
jgi:hypothetical protein